MELGQIFKQAFTARRSPGQSSRQYNDAQSNMNPCSSRTRRPNQRFEWFEILCQCSLLAQLNQDSPYLTINHISAPATLI